MYHCQRMQELFDQYIDQHRIAGASVIVRRNGEVLLKLNRGYADIENHIPMDEHIPLRLASMTKPIIAIAVMMLAERGKLSIDDPVSKYLPGFQSMKAADRLIGFMEHYEADPDNPSMPKTVPSVLEGVKLVNVSRQITLRDMLSHSSGMGSGPFSMDQYERGKKPTDSLQDRIDLISSLPLDFQPGSHTAYSASVAFDVLGRVIEVVSGVDLNQFIVKNISEPMGCRTLAFILPREENQKVCRLYESSSDGMKDVSGTEPFWKDVSAERNGYFSGSAGMLGSVEDYDQIVQMLAQDGIWNGVRLLKPDTVRMMRTEASVNHLEMCPGMVWGLGMAVSEAPEKTGRTVGQGTYGWSGAYGTHFYIDPENGMTVTLGVNCSNIGGADSVFSKDVEKVVWSEFCEKV